MFFRLIQIVVSAFRYGHIGGYLVTRNPIAWIPFFLVLPIALALLVMGYVLSFFFLPIIALGAFAVWKAFARKTGVFSEQGVSFTEAYGRRTIAWSDIREVVRQREPKAIFYRIVCSPGGERVQELIMCWTPDDDAFERTLEERGIPFRVHDWRQGTEMGPRS